MSLLVVKLRPRHISIWHILQQNVVEVAVNEWIKMDNILNIYYEFVARIKFLDK